MRLSGLFSPSIPDETALMVEGEPVTVKVRVSARARHYRLTLDPRGDAILTVPARGRWREAERFLAGHGDWLAERRRRLGPVVVFADGARIPVRGVPHRIVATGRVRGRVQIEGTAGEPLLLVPGDAPHLPRRLTAWLKAEAATDLDAACARHAGRLGVTVAAIRLRAQSTRWGSCASSGVLNFNWRLILAPDFVLDYVAAHEVAHRVEMNHSPAFWAAVRKTLPEMERGRDWLKQHGRALLAIG